LINLLVRVVLLINLSLIVFCFIITDFLFGLGGTSECSELLNVTLPMFSYGVGWGTKSSTKSLRFVLFRFPSYGFSWLWDKIETFLSSWADNYGPREEW